MTGRDVDRIVAHHHDRGGLVSPRAGRLATALPVALGIAATARERRLRRRARFTTTDHRHPGDALSRLAIEAKNDPEAAGRAGQLLAELVETPWNGMAADLITSVPPKPAQEHDRLDSVLAAQRRTSPWR